MLASMRELVCQNYRIQFVYCRKLLIKEDLMAGIERQDCFAMAAVEDPLCNGVGQPEGPCPHFEDCKIAVQLSGGQGWKALNQSQKLDIEAKIVAAKATSVAPARTRPGAPAPAVPLASVPVAPVVPVAPLASASSVEADIDAELGDLGVVPGIAPVTAPVVPLAPAPVVPVVPVAPVAAVAPGGKKKRTRRSKAQIALDNAAAEAGTAPVAPEPVAPIPVEPVAPEPVAPEPVAPEPVAPVVPEPVVPVAPIPVEPVVPEPVAPVIPPTGSKELEELAIKMVVDLGAELFQLLKNMNSKYDKGYVSAIVETEIAAGTPVVQKRRGPKPGAKKKAVKKVAKKKVAKKKGKKKK